MPVDTSAVLAAIAFLAAKHTLADFFLQMPYQYRNKGRYGHPGGLIHAGLHAGLTLPVYLVLAPPSPLIAALVPAAEFAIHYHIDWLKEQATERNRWGPADAWYWRALGLDQFAHTLTYIGIVAVLAA